jgi:hypothetical protein
LTGRRLGRGGWIVAAAGLFSLVAVARVPMAAQRGGMFLGSADDPGIRYSTVALRNAVDDLNRRLLDGSTTLTFQGRSGYLRSVAEALKLPVDSQLVLYSKGSLQGRLVSPTNPRALFFNDRVALGWVRDADLLEVAAYDEAAGMVFYSLEQKPAERPVFKREFRCLGCHMAGDTSGVPGLLMFSSTTDPVSGRDLRLLAMDHRSPHPQRFGGWFVTGSSATGHIGNRVPALDGRGAGELSSLTGVFEADGYLGTSSDIAALLTFSHQVGMVNLLTRASWEARAADPALHPGGPDQARAVDALMSGIANEVVDYMLFVEEPTLPRPVTSQSGFAGRMASTGPRDRKGRSLYELELTHRLLKYPCSYLIYSPAFDALPPLASAPIYRRLWEVLSGQATEPRYRALSLADRQAIVEILRDTKPELPAYFTTVTR